MSFKGYGEDYEHFFLINKQSYWPEYTHIIISPNQTKFLQYQADPEPWTLDPGLWTLDSGPWTLDL